MYETDEDEGEDEDETDEDKERLFYLLFSRFSTPNQFLTRISQKPFVYWSIAFSSQPHETVGYLLVCLLFQPGRTMGHLLISSMLSIGMGKYDKWETG